MSQWRRLIAPLLPLAVILAVAGATFALPHAAHAQGVFDVCSQAGASGSSICHANGSNNLSGPNGIIIKVANIFAFVGGVAAVIVIMIGGFMYVTASGDAGKANSGRNAVVYAAIGLVVIVLGRAIIGYVIIKFK